MLLSIKKKKKKKKKIFIALDYSHLLILESQVPQLNGIRLLQSKFLIIKFVNYLIHFLLKNLKKMKNR